MHDSNYPYDAVDACHNYPIYANNSYAHAIQSYVIYAQIFLYHTYTCKREYHDNSNNSPVLDNKITIPNK